MHVEHIEQGNIPSLREKDVNNILGDARRTEISLDEQVFEGMRFSIDKYLHRMGNYHDHLE